MDDRQTAFNMNQATLLRLDNLLKNIHFLLATNQLIPAKINLDALYRELSPYISREPIDSRNKFTEMKDRVNRIFNSCNSTTSIKINKSDSQMMNVMINQNNDQLYNVLTEWDVLLRDLMFRKGLYMVYGKDPRKAAMS